MSEYLQLLMLLICVVPWGSSVPSGAPPGACATLSPSPAPPPAGHGAAAQTTTVPYEIDLTSLNDLSGALSYVPGESYSLTFQSTDGNTFRGVLLQGRVMADDTTTAGTFEDSDALLRLSSCVPSEISVTHNTPSDKTVVTTEWTAPAEGTGDVRIGFAVVRTQMTYWSDQRSALIAERVVDTNMTTAKVVTGGADNIETTTEDGDSGSVMLIGNIYLACIFMCIAF